MVVALAVVLVSACGGQPYQPPLLRGPHYSVRGEVLSVKELPRGSALQ